ncbi:hypothetical protein FisN_2Hh353 [Fistulifera solaris]|uniref:FZ domain-containing protein n=1 Tax=Fistulifera solaris TaxID=1519565 RepID=A0A1Z5KK54_FISSO|nr:hypothetical protein FisN_2Hh353 [Fistulifera solaris]|eukprot:GAX26700.1 hypothetical protein FisN_2Hh353 [Fistulifera solaris]
MSRTISRQQSTLAFLVFWCLLSMCRGAFECPAATAPCMNEENHAQCMKLLESGCEEFDTFESCPLQFACSKQLVTDACVTLLVFPDDKCTGKPLQKMTFPTFSKPRNDCYHDEATKNLSIQSRYCDRETGNWHETVYFGSEDCGETKPWWQFWSTKSMDIVFTPDNCVDGYRLGKCQFQPCDSEMNGKAATADS